MSSLTKLVVMCLAMALVLINLADAGAIDNNDSSEKSEEKNSPHPHDHIHEITTKKAGVFQSIVNKLGFGHKTKPLKDSITNIHNKIKPKPITVTSTKTVVLEVTKRIIRNPICIAYKKGINPCILRVGHDVTYKDESGKEVTKTDESVGVAEYEHGSLYIEPSETVKMNTETGLAVPEIIDDEGTEAEIESDSRSKRYIKFTDETPAISDVKPVIEEGEIDESEVDEEGRYLFQKINTHVVTKTLWVTKVQKVTDYKVTATLVPHNCVPADLNFPSCSNHGPDVNLWKEEAKKIDEFTAPKEFPEF